MISYEDFAKLDLRVGKVLAAEPVEGADKLLRLEVDCGEKRQLVAGLAEDYSAEELVGKQIAVVVNLEHKELRGVRSQGMLLAAEDGDDIALLVTDRKVKDNAKVR